jgi:hypothetical protein
MEPVRRLEVMIAAPIFVGRIDLIALLKRIIDLQAPEVSLPGCAIRNAVSRSFRISIPRYRAAFRNGRDSLGYITSKPLI